MIVNVLFEMDKLVAASGYELCVCGHGVIASDSIGKNEYIYIFIYLVYI